MENDVRRSCVDCGVVNCDVQNKSYPPFCLTTHMDKTVKNEAMKEYTGENRKVMQTAAKVEYDGYCVWTRVQETVEFMKRMGYHKIGIATCVGLIQETRELTKILRSHGFEVYGIGCKVGAVAKTEFIEIVEKIRDFLAGIRCEEVDLSCTVAVVYGKEDTMSRLEATMRYARARRVPIAQFDEIGDIARKELEEIRMLHIIRDALQHKRVRPYFQEIHNNRGDRKRMYESLMRIFDEDGKLYFPDQFLPVAKEYDLYESLSELMVETVIEMFRDKDIRVTINLNVQDIYDRKMLRMIFESMQTVPHPENFVFEIVESEEIMDYAYIKEFADRIHEYGGKVAIDDFGSGFSNLLHVLKIQADYIKIDGAIIRTITEDPHCLDFIRFINNWCVGNQQEVIAEYVENQQIQYIMMDIGVAHSQGYYYSKPHPWVEE